MKDLQKDGTTVLQDHFKKCTRKFGSLEANHKEVAQDHYTVHVGNDNPEYLLIHTTTLQSPKPNVYIKIKTTIFDLHLKTKDLKTSQFINFQNTDNLKNLKVEFQFIIKARKTD